MATRRFLNPKVFGEKGAGLGPGRRANRGYRPGGLPNPKVDEGNLRVTQNLRVSASIGSIFVQLPAICVSPKPSEGGVESPNGAR